MGCPLAIEQHKPKQKKMRFLVTLAFLLAVASLATSARLKREACAGTDTEAKCFESFDEYKFIKPYMCEKECKNCNLCDGSSTVKVCQYCVEGPGKCTELCEAGKKKCCACDEASGLC